MAHPFGEEEEASLRSLHGFFCWCLHRANWELARACLPQLYRGARAGEVEEILTALVTAPHLLSCDENHSPQKLSWFWLSALETWQGWGKELYEAFLYSHQDSSENRREISGPKLGPDTVSLLRTFLARDPRLVQALIGFLLIDHSHPSALEYNHLLLNISVGYLLDLIKSLQESQQRHDSKEMEKIAEQIYGVLSTMHFNGELQANELKHLCQELFTACWNTGSVLAEEQIQQCMLRKQNYALVSLAILALFCDPDQVNPWKTAYFYCLSTGKHFLEQILLTSLTLLKREDFTRLSMLLRNELKPLRRLLVLLGWTHCHSIESAKMLLCTLHQNKDLYNDLVLKEFCDGLVYQVEALEWCIQHNSQGIPKKDVLRHLYGLDRHSALYILHHLTRLPELNEEEVLKLLKKGQASAGDDASYQQDCHYLIPQRNTVMFQAFCAMKYAMYALCVNAHRRTQCRDCLPHLLNGSSEDTEFPCVPEKETLVFQDLSAFFVQYFTKCQYYLQLLPAPFRLEILENIFSLLFVSLSDLNKEPAHSEDYPVEDEEEVKLNLKTEGLGVLDSSLDKGESVAVSSPIETTLNKDCSFNSADLSGISNGSPASTVDSSQRTQPILPRPSFLDLKHFTKGLSGFLADEVVLDQFLKMLTDHVEELKDCSPWSGHNEETKLLECMNLSVTKETFSSRVLQLSKYISDTQWRYNVVMSNRNTEEELFSSRRPHRTFKASSFRRRNRKIKGANKKQMESTSSELSTSESCASNLSAVAEADPSMQSRQRNLLIPMMLSPPESLLISCILRGNYPEAHQVALMFNLQSTSSYGELIFMERYQDVVRELSRVEQRIENQTSESGARKLSNSRSTLQAIGSAAAAGMVFYSISDVTDKLLAPAEGPIPTLQDDFWAKSARLEKSDPWRHVLEELNPSAMAAFDLACTQAHLWKTCKQLLETAERRLNCSLETKGRKPDCILDHPEGIRGLAAVLQQLSKIINYPSSSLSQTELEERINSQFKCNIMELFHTCYPVLNDECIVHDITLGYELEQILAQLKAAIVSHEPKGNPVQSLMDQSSTKPQDVQVHPVRQQMDLLLKNLDEHGNALNGHGPKPDNVKKFFTYIDTMAKVIIQSINTELDPSLEVKVGNPFILLHQKPSQMISHMLFERQVPPERLSALLDKENLGVSVEQVIADYCCEPMSFCIVRKHSHALCLRRNIGQITQHCLTLPDMEISIPSCAHDEEDHSPASPTPDHNPCFLTASALNFLKSKSRLAAALACLSAAKSQKPSKSGLSWMELIGSKKESPLDMETITKECDSLLLEFPVLQRFISAMAAPFRDCPSEANSFAGALCGKPCAALVLLGLHSPTANAVVTETFQETVATKDWSSALQFLDLYNSDLKDLVEVRDALLSCAAAEEKDGHRYLFSVKDPGLRSKLAICFLHKWPLDACIEILSYCVCEPEIDEDLKRELQNKRSEMEVYQKILSLKEDSSWVTWQELKKDCKEDPHTIISIMLDAKDYTLCEEWEKFYPVPMELLISLHCEHLLHLLGNQDTDKAIQLLQRIDDQSLRCAISEQALLQQSSIFACHFFSEYLLNNFHNGKSEAKLLEIRDVYMGSKILLALPESAHSSSKHLISSPLLLLEQLLMNMKIDWVAVAVQTIKQFLDELESSFSTEDVDKLLCTYAGKALDIPFSFRERRSDSMIRNTESCGQLAEPESTSLPSTPEPSTPSIADRIIDRSRFQTPPSSQEKLQRRIKSSPEFVPPEKPPAKTQWIPDEREITCMVCKNERFTMFNRRHHCRRCGRLVCSSCSMKRMVVEDCRENPARVCDQCHAYFSTKPGGNLDLAEILKLSKAAELQWCLTVNEQENEVERSEFYYEQAPSASLCSAILNLHSKSEECGYQLIERCCMLSKDLTNPEMDSRLLLDMMKNLLFSAKMIFVKAARSQDLALCDSYSSKVDLLKILVAASYQEIPSLDEIVRPAAVIRLRNQLLEAEYYNLAIENDDDYFATLKELKATLKPNCIWFEMMSEEKHQHNKYYQECLHYLHTYGTHLAIIQFYMRRDRMREALLHLLNKECPGDIFIEGIFVPSYESGKLQMLETLLESLDPTLESWSTYLIEACKHLQQKNFYNILYELQQFMKDHIRAAMTCIRFFSYKAKSYRELGDNMNWLVKSKEHLKTCLQEMPRGNNKRKSYDPFRKKMSNSEISRKVKHINTVELQMAITKFLQRCENSGTSQTLNKPPPTLFGDSGMIIDVACRVILGGKNVEEGFGLAFRVIQDFQLNAAKVYGKVCKQLVGQEHYTEILQLVKCVSESGIAAENDCDQILLRCIEEMADMSSDELEKLIQGMRSDENKIKAFLTCRMMRSAYLTAVKQEHERAIQLVQEVWQAARRLDDKVVQGICHKWLLEHPPKSKEAHKHSSRK
ncbi:hypothetical protein XELAEV_18040158mg [Xenopus laevis]|uniref:Zinc finger FYVE domain-containing protein 26 n=1 Tax=Xenopus laevis TaxID=8355 RepID=A0A974H8N0_XENLA|nr:hypothetical protein XELAEV_18040158mg [Xenopus laevis]